MQHIFENILMAATVFGLFQGLAFIYGWMTGKRKTEHAPQQAEQAKTKFQHVQRSSYTFDEPYDDARMKQWLKDERERITR